MARYGGEEFVAVLVGKGPDETRRVAEKVRHDVEGTRPDAAESCKPQHFASGLSP